ncbi:MAG: PQQ-dependent sugar dehydrogenase [Chlorobi bacterium]|nr:PQQ-dependent sugar dehydrogenase [Chlorobiota bacterium]
MIKYLLTLFIFLHNLTIYSQSYQFETKITGLSAVTCFEFLSADNVIINQKTGLSKIYTLNNVFISNFWNFTDSTNSGGECGLIGVCLDPAYSSNHYIYFYYIHNNGNYRVVRLTNNNNIGSSPFIVFNAPAIVSTIHVGGNIHFGRDGKLYISIGENGTGSNSQSLTTFKGKILRINSNGTIPTNNPFYDDGNPLTGNDDRIWALGLRNSYDFTFSPINDSLYATENSAGSPDEVNYIIKGKNYGWPICQGYCNPYNPLYKQPLDTITGSGVVNYAPTGIIVYTGSVMPELYGRLIYGGYGLGPIKGIMKATLGNPPFYDTVLTHVIINPLTSITCIKQGADGYIYLSIYAPGAIYKMVYNTSGINNNNAPVNFSLSQNYPNPFNPVTKIKYEIPKSEFVTLKIYNVLGIEIVALVDEQKQTGSYETEWNASSFPSGVFFYELQAGDFIDRKKMVLLK